MDTVDLITRHFGNTIPRTDLVMLIRDGVDSIGLLISPDQVRTEMRSLFFDGETRRTDAATILLIEASEYLNNGWELVGNALKGYALYAIGTDMRRPYRYFGEPIPNISFPYTFPFNLG